MNYAERLEQVSVLGAAGKMGSGIVLLAALEMADLSLDPANRSIQFTLNAVDVSSRGLAGLLSYLRSQIKSAAERKMVALRSAFAGNASLVENEDVINHYVETTLAIVRPTTRLEAAYESGLVFEAVNEDPGLKVKLLSRVCANASGDAWFMTNTSSIPIHELDESVRLEGRIIGFHFYNPPAVQKLVELIRAGATRPDLADFALQFAKKLRKTVVPSNDVAGFIGNGHFMRDALHGVAEVERLTAEFGFPGAVYLVNRVSQDFLIRPMGIFQLIDYVGLDVCGSILRVMDARLPGDALRSGILDDVASKGILGGQHPDGSPKDGFLKYEKGRPAAVYDAGKSVYVPFSEIAPRCDEKLGPLPGQARPWKQVVSAPDKSVFLENHFRQLREMNTLGAELARAYGRRSKEIGLGLVRDGVAASEDDVNTVLLTGFFHAYGPINTYFD